MELFIVVVVTLIAAALGGWYGYYLARKQTNRVRTVEVSLELFSGDFSTKRTEFLSKLRNLKPEEIKIAASRDDERFQELRQASFDIFNRYDLVCYLLNEGDLDRAVLSKYALPIIQSDYAETDSFFQAIEDDYKAREIEDRRPFFPEVAKVAPRAGFSTPQGS